MLGVSHLARSLEFYRDMLGLDVAFQAPGFGFLNGGGVMLCLSEPLAKAGGPLTGATEVVSAVPAVDQAYEALSAYGIEFVQGPREVAPGQWAANFRDPDGHLLSVFGPKA
jgi:catechol 2,3-dioxygenase-like lactoylglutathione lyase family enzyme